MRDMPIQTPIRHPRIRAVRDTGLFNGEGDFEVFEVALAAYSASGAKKRDVGDVWEVFCEAFLRLDPEVIAADVWPDAALPTAMRREFVLPVSDEGCDGIYKCLNDGSTVAYQAKFRSRRAPITWEELGTFAGVTDRVAERVVLTNADIISKTALDRQGMRVLNGGYFASRVDARQMDEIRALVHAKPAPHKLSTPQPHQTEAIRDIVAGLANSSRATVLMACGTGKTLTALWATQELAPETVVVLLPSLSLVSQTITEWAKEHPWGDRFRFLAVCSDDTVADEDVVHAVPSELPYRIRTVPGDVPAFLAGHGDGLVRVVFSTYQSADVLAQDLPVGFSFDVGIFDEAHKTAGREGSQFSFALTDDNLAIAKRLFLTATPRTHSVRVRGEAQVIHSMDDEAVYGPVVHNLTFGKAADLGIICRYKVLVSVVTSVQVAAAIANADTIVDGAIISASDVAGQLAMARAIEAHGLNKIFSFHQSIRAAKAFVAEGPAGVGRHLPAGFSTFHVSGQMSAKRRKEELDLFSNAGRAVISNARCLTEGVDVPAVDMTAFMNRKTSKVDIVQAIGRCLRKRRDNVAKEYGYVLVPLLVDQLAGESIEDAVKRSDFTAVFEVLRALMDEDQALVDRIDELRREAVGARGYGVGGLEGFVEVLGADIPLDILSRSIDVRIADQLGNAFEDWFGRLELYVAATGDARVPQSYVDADGCRLGAWVNKCRQAYIKRKMDPGVAVRFERLHGWSWTPKADDFLANFRRLEVFVERTGNARVPSGHIEDGVNLGIWVVERRADYRNEAMNPTFATRLERLPGWSWDPKLDDFEAGFRRLEAFVERTGTARMVATHKEEDGFNLGVWVFSYRRAYRLRKMDPDTAARFEQLPGWSWNPNAADLETNFKRLEAFVKRTGNSRVSYDHMENGHPLGEWVASCRRRHRKEDLNAAIVARFEQVPGWSWNPFRDDFEANFKRLEEFARAKNHCRMPRRRKGDRGRKEDGADLGSWVTTCRTDYKNDKLTREQIRRFEALPGWSWDAREDLFQAGFIRLRTLVKRHGQASVPNDTVFDGFRLGQWVNNVCAAKRRGILSQQRIVALEALPGWSWTRKADKFEAGFKFLVAFVEREKTAMVPRGHCEGKFRLGAWVMKQRAGYRDDKLPSDRRDRLQAVAGWSWGAAKEQTRA